MKTRKIIIAVIFSILILGSNQYSSVHAEKEDIEETIHEQVPQIKRSSVSLDESSLQRNVESYLQSKYGTQDWYRMADFYLKINFRKHNYDEFEKVYQSFVNESIFRILDKEVELNFLSLECKFYNLIPSIIIIFNNLYPLKIILFRLKHMVF